MKKFKVLVLSDHSAATSGVGCQSLHLMQGLIKKGCWTFRQFGAALKHTDYRTMIINDDLIIKPIDGFGNRDLIRVALATERPDALFIFTDPRFFIWLFEMEDEIHQICPIVWWHVWDNAPRPAFNDVLYDSTDLLNCHSYMTYELIKDKYLDKTNFVPHALPPQLFYQLPKEQIRHYRSKILGEDRKDHFVGIWVNRNAKRKRPNDVILSWKYFLDQLEAQHGHRNATLIMHTDPLDQEGPNLYVTSEMLKVHNNIFFSKERLEFEKMNILYNVADVCINISFAEGFGLSTLEAMQCGTPIVALKTGGLTRQAVDHRDATHNGVALDVECRTLVGSQQVPHIFEDYCSCESVAKAIYKIFDLSPSERDDLSRKVASYVASEFNYQTTVDKWHETMLHTINTWREKRQDWKLITI